MAMRRIKRWVWMSAAGDTRRCPKPSGAATVGVLLALGLFAASCGSAGDPAAQTVVDDAPVDVVDTEANVLAKTETADSDPPEETAAEAESTEDVAAEEEPAERATPEPVALTPLELGEPDWGGLTEWYLPALGGLTFGVPDGYVVHHDADMVTIRESFDADAGRYVPSMVLGLVAKNGSRQAVTAVTDMTQRAIDGIAKAESTGASFELFDVSLEGFRFRLNPGLADGPHYLYGAYPDGSDGASHWQPLPHAEVFLGETPHGVLSIGWTARTEEGLTQARAIFDRIAPTLGLTEGLGGGPFTSPEGPGGPPPEPVVLPDGVEPWELASSLVQPGTYTSANVGTMLEFTLDDGWWVQPNFPGWLVLSAIDSFGPGDRGVAIRTGLDSIVPTHRAGVAGEAISIDLATWADGSPPAGIEVTSSGETEVGGAAGMFIDFTIGLDVACDKAEPCEYAVVFDGPYPPDSFRKGYHHRLWYLTEGVNEPVTILAVTPDPSWLAVVDELTETMIFTPSP